jgi:GNAT superfamily N-acetyltransferase
MIRIEIFNAGEEQLIEQMIREVYDEFVAPDYSEEGNIHFYEFIKPENILERVNKGNIIFTAKNGKKIIGMIELKDYNHICLLFVDRQFQGLGIARDLFNKILALVKKKDFRIIDVHSSLFAVPVYQRLGFIITDKIQEIDGIIFVPMKYELNQ